ncbi:MAG: glycosyltransferase family 4 protein [Anaerolineae bacterium]|nr:glycosyltransferase family 4 protein [Anaerolineae bacterium]
MKIAIFHNLPSGGAKRALYEWVRRLAEPHVLGAFSLSTAEQAFLDIQPYVREHRVFDFSPLPIFRSPWGRLNHVQRWRDLGRLTQIGREIAETINAGEYDVVFAHACMFTFIPTVMRYLQIPSVYYLHEPFGPTFTREFDRPYLERHGIRRYLHRLAPIAALYKNHLERIRRQSVDRTTLLLANSEFTRQEIMRAYGVAAPVVRCGVNFESFKPAPGGVHSNYVISVGALTPRKGFDFLIRSLALVEAYERPVLKLACNGQIPEERAYIEALAAAHGVTLDIQLNLSTEQLVQAYNDALFCLYAPVKEPFGLVPLEAMACGKAVVGVAEGGVLESVVDGETGILTPRDPAQFAEAVCTLLRDRELRDRYASRGRVYIQDRWSWEDSTALIESHLRAVSSG